MARSRQLKFNWSVAKRAQEGWGGSSRAGRDAQEEKDSKGLEKVHFASTSYPHFFLLVDRSSGILGSVDDLSLFCILRQPEPCDLLILQSPTPHLRPPPILFCCHLSFRSNTTLSTSLLEPVFQALLLCFCSRAVFACSNYIRCLLHVLAILYYICYAYSRR